MSVLTVILFGALIVLAARLDLEPEPTRLSGAVRVQDGDSLELGGERIRLKGIDAPEFDQICARGGDYPCGRMARDALVRLAARGPVSCEGWQRDRYRRLLAVCRAGGAELNARQVSDGWALAYGGYEAEEDAARRASRGLWAGTFDQPSAWRAQKGDAAESPHDLVQTLINFVRRVFRMA